MNNVVIKRLFKGFVAGALLTLGVKIIYDVGRQEGVSLTEQVVNQVSPETHAIITEMIKQS